MSEMGQHWLFVSDAHLSGKDPGAIRRFLSFLNSESERVGYLMILGDLFEFLFGFKEKPSGKGTLPFMEYLPVLKELQRLNRRGVQIKYFEGNHDFNLRSFFSERWGMDVEVFPEGHEERIGQRRAFVAHGDLSTPRIWHERIFRRMIKNRWTYGLIEKAGPTVSCRVARWLSRRSYQKNHHLPLLTPPPGFREFAHQKFLEGFDLVILGHSHFPDEVEESIDGRRCLYFNVGDWMEHRSFLRFIPPDQFLLRRWEDD